MLPVIDSTSDLYELDPSYPHPAEVEAEYSKATLMPDSRDWLAGRGVPADAMAGVAECTSGFVRDDHFNIHFKIDPNSQRATAVRTAFHVPVHHEGRFVDLIRFERQHQRAGHLLHGGRICHGVSWLGSPLPDESAPTPIWRSPLGWLKSGRQGLCYLRLSWPVHRLALLRGLPAVMGEDIEHARLLHKVVWRYDDDRKQRPAHWARFPKATDVMPLVAAEFRKSLKAWRGAEA
jgi:hypothetical protein